jgi:pimeloyl-ACP methyl ester carboxylesterase
MFGRPADWEPVARQLGEDWPVVVPDLPVFDFPSGSCGLEHLCGELLRVIDAAGFRRVVLAGNSLGGHVALLTALAQPERVRGLVLTGSSGLFERGFERGVPRRPDREWIRRKVAEVFFDPAHVTDELLDEVTVTIRNPHMALNIVRLARAVKRGNLRGQLARIRCPVTLIWGAEDRITPPEVAREFAAHLPDAELHFLERCGHAPPIEHPGEFARLFRHSLERLVA